MCRLSSPVSLENLTKFGKIHASYMLLKSHVSWLLFTRYTLIMPSARVVYNFAVAQAKTLYCKKARIIFNFVGGKGFSELSDFFIN